MQKLKGKVLGPLIAFLQRFTLAKRVANRRYQPNQEELIRLLKWLYSTDESLPSKGQSDLICKAINTQFIAKVSKSDLAKILYGIIQYRKTSFTPSDAHQAFVRVFEQTNGIGQELIHSALFHKDVTHISGDFKSEIFGSVNHSDVQEDLESLRKHGYCKLHKNLNPEYLSELTKDINAMRFSPRGKDSWSLINPSSPPICNVADVHPVDLQSSKLIKSIVSDPLLIRLASEYLQSDVKLLSYCMWYSFPARSASSEAAQLFHYDLDTLRWLKIFIFLSDVEFHNGPHEYVESTHIPGSKPVSMLRRGYSRLEDSEIDAFYSGRRKQLIGASGSIFLADTRCYHKGVNPDRGYRLVLQPIYAASALSYNQY